MATKMIGLCISYNHINYGTLLQAFATQYAVERLGYETEIIDYHPGKETHPRYNAAHFLLMGRFLLFDLTHRKPALDQAHSDGADQRKAAAEQFRRDYLHSMVSCRGYTELCKTAGRYKAVITGSDQIWNPRTANSSFYTLRFVPPGIRRISYASSMGVSKYPWYLRGEASDFLSKIDCLSVREESAASIISGLIGKTPMVVCDPTGLLTAEEWAHCIKPELPEKEYIFCYFLGDCRDGRELAVSMAAKTGLPVWGIAAADHTADESYCDKVFYDADVPAFVNLIRGASMVLTDSFHGTMLSLIHEKEFFVFHRMRKNTPYQRNARIDDLLRHMGLTGRLVTGNNIPQKKIDYSVFTPVMEQFRAESVSFLRQSLEGL